MFGHKYLTCGRRAVAIRPNFYTIILDLTKFHDREEPKNDSLLYRKYRFAIGVWMEELIQRLAQEASPKTEFLYGQHFAVNKTEQKFESDIVAVNNHRLRYLSITSKGATSKDQKGRESDYKGKIFEAIHRALQLGGGLAQSGLICPADAETVAKVQASIGKNSRHKIYGRDDVHEWIDGNYATLKTFLQG